MAETGTLDAANARLTGALVLAGPDVVCMEAVEMSFVEEFEPGGAQVVAFWGKLAIFNADALAGALLGSLRFKTEVVAS